jgi:CubicO group peptidase (beta-lactamase class C family)
MIRASIRKYTGLLETVTLSLITSAIPMLAQSRDLSPDGDFSEIAAAMQRRIDSGMPSIAIAVARHGKIVWEHAAGKSDIERNSLPQ